MQDLCGFPVYPAGEDPIRAQRELEALELGDGLPLVMPTRARIEAMLDGVTCAEQVHGLLPPLFGELRLDALAYQCVLAGCEPPELPVVFTAARACLDPDFNLLGLLTTTGTAAVALMVHGEIARTLGLSSTSNCLGPGARANACIGRALSLVLRNVAGAREGVADMATMGQPGKFTFCFAESDAGDGLPSFLQRQGQAPACSAVTVLGVSGTAEVLPLHGGGRPEDILAPVALAMSTAVLVSGAREREPAHQVVLLPPELVNTLGRHGFGLDEIQTFLYTQADVSRLCDAAGLRGIAPAGPVAASPAHIHPIQTGGPGVKMTYVPLWAGGSAPATRMLETPGDAADP